MSFDKSDLVGRRDALRILGMGSLSVVGRGQVADAHPEQQQANAPLRTIGVLGGLGPQVTMDFEARVHRAAQRLIPQRENSGYPPMVVYYHRHPPILLNDDSLPRFPIQPHPRLLDEVGDAAGATSGSWVSATQWSTRRRSPA